MGSAKEFYVVGIGASAGGLEAIESFFSKVPPDSGLAFVIIQHLSPDYKSLMPEILLKRTSLPVHTAEDGMEVKPDNVYLIPRKMNMKIFHARLHLTEKNNLQVLNLPIDIFFHSLAEDFEDKAIGVILSGTGSDGSRGIRVIKENGGIIIAQDPDSSKFDGMPKSAITTGTVDYILSPQEIPEKIMSYVKHPYIIDKGKNHEHAKVPEDYLSKIILFIKENFGLDFTYYKDTTISRRIERRLSINQIENLKDYLDYLYSSKNEQKTLYKELLIGVTKFFRDLEAFQIVENEIIPSIFENKLPGDEIRIWVSACSTGEEAYSVAILFKEHMVQHQLQNKIKIFATDVDKSAIEFASMGIYNTSITADVSPERLNRFFIQAGDSLRINDEIREMIVFARHNVIQDPPFNKIDFLLCRNLLIYFQNALQQKVLSLFNFALNNTGYLFLGNSESIGDMEHYYETVNIKWKIFKSKRTGKLPSDIMDEKFPGGLINPQFQMRKPVYALKSPVADLVNIFTEKIIEDIAPETVIVNENYEIINSFGDLNKFLIFPKTRRITEGFDYIITKMVPSNLKLTFSIAINKAIKSGNEVIHHQVKFQKSEKEFIIADLKFIPLLKKELFEKYVLIYFYEKDFSQVSNFEIKSYEDVDQQAQQRIFDLENELKHTKENLQASIEELETTNEELQSTNEELVSANEELQSTNEELQSVNEELYTVNTEFQAKNHDLLVMNNDMENLLQNSEVRIIFLDPELKIRKFTENISDIFNLKKNDLERPLSDITHHVRDVDLVAMARGIIQNNVPVKKTVKAKDRWYHMKFLPYTTQKGYRDGVVISFIDVSDFINSQNELRISEGRFKKVIETGFDAFYLLKPKTDEHGEIIDFIIADINKKAEEQMSMSREKLLGKGICELFPVNINNGYFQMYKKVAQSGTPFEQEYQISDEFAAPGWFYQQVVPEEDGVMIFNRDISARKQMEFDLQKTTNLYQALFKNMTKGFALHQIITDSLGNPVDYRFIDVNQHFEIITGLKKDEIQGRTILEVLPEIEKIWIEKYGKVALTGEHLIFEQESKILKKTFRVNAYSPIHGQFATLFEEI
jgi:two-component system, chemotaxis family, CheB/CheR fusion protein